MPVILALAACLDQPDLCATPEDGCESRDSDRDRDGDPYPDDCDDADPALTSQDGDGDGWSTCDGDCDDDDGDRGPRGLSEERCDDVDNDCNGVVDEDDAGVRACERSVQVEPPEVVSVDVLVVVHTDPTMRGAVQDLRSAVPGLVPDLLHTDTHLAIATSSPSAPGLLRGFGSDPWLDVAASTEDELTAWLAGSLPLPAAGFEPVPDESFRAARDVLDAIHPTAEGWRRPQADLVVVFATTADDVSDVGVEGIEVRLRDEGPTRDLAEMVRQQVFVTPFTWTASGAAQCAGLATGVRYEALAGAIGETPRSICDLAAQFELAVRPHLPANLVVIDLEHEPIVVTLRADLRLSDGRQVTVGSDELRYLPPGDGHPPRVAVPDYRWDQISWGDVRYDVVP